MASVSLRINIFNLIKIVYFNKSKGEFMKKLIKFMLLFCIIVSLSFAQSQINKGTYKIGGELSYKSYHFGDKEDNYYNFSLTPQFYYFLLKNLSIGISTDYLYSKKESGYGYERIGLAPGIIYNFNYKSVYPFIFVEVGRESIWTIRVNANNNYRKLPYSKVGCGLDIFLLKSVSIEPYVYYKDYASSAQTPYKNIIGTGIRIATFLH